MPPVVNIIAFVLAITATLILVLWGVAKLMTHFNVTLPETNYPSDDDQPAQETAESISKIVVTDLDRARFRIDSAILGTSMLGVLTIVRAIRFQRYEHGFFYFIIFGMIVYGLSMKSRLAAVLCLLFVMLEIAVAVYAQRYWSAVALLGLAGIIWQGVANVFLHHRLKAGSNTAAQI